MQHVRYIKSFSKGQITIPKEFRDAIGIGDESWMKLYVEDGKLIAQPVTAALPRKEWLAGLQEISVQVDLGSELEQGRRALKDRLPRTEL